MIEVNQSTTIRVCFDAHMIGSHETGNESYAADLAAALAHRPDLRCTAVVQSDIPLPKQWSAGQPEVVKLRSTNNWLRLAYTLPQLCRKIQADILHVTYIAPFVSPCPIVVTVHDVIFKRFPQFFSARDRLLFAALLPLTLRRASAIITDSESSCTDILNYYPYTHGKVYVAALAPSPVFNRIQSHGAVQKTCDHYGIGPRFILAVGNLQPRKNLNRLVQAFRGLIAQGLTECQLVLVGKDAYQSDLFRREISDLISSGKLILTGYLPDKDLAALYHAATAFVYPSLFEGFGLPILEAMACGTPVVTSNVSSMPGVAGNAALLINPVRVDQIQFALESIVNHPDLARRLSNLGQRRAQQFTWDQTARRIAEVYQYVLNRADNSVEL